MGLVLIAAGNLVVQSCKIKYSLVCFSNSLLDHFQMSSGNCSCLKSFDEVSSPSVAKSVI
jgi:hypothetical protein